MRKRFYFQSGDAIGFRRSLENEKIVYDGAQHWLENPSFWVRTEVGLEKKIRCFILEDTSQKVDNIHRAICFAHSCKRPFAI